MTARPALHSLALQLSPSHAGCPHQARRLILGPLSRATRWRDNSAPQPPLFTCPALRLFAPICPSHFFLLNTFVILFSTSLFETFPILYFDSCTTLIMAPRRHRRKGKDKGKGKDLATARAGSPAPSTPARPRETQASSATRGPFSGSIPRSNASSSASRSSARARALAMSPSRGSHMSGATRSPFEAGSPTGANSNL